MLFDLYLPSTDKNIVTIKEECAKDVNTFKSKLFSWNKNSKGATHTSYLPDDVWAVQSNSYLNLVLPSFLLM